METPQERVFNSVDLRHEILKHVIEPRVRTYNMMKRMLGPVHQEYCRRLVESWEPSITAQDIAGILD